MLFHVEMTVRLPTDMDPVKAATLKAEEKAMCQRLMNEGTWRHLWRIAGQYANVSIFDVESVQQLHDLLSEPVRIFVGEAVEQQVIHAPA